MAIIVTVRRFKTNGDYKTGTNSSIYELKSATVYQNPITNIYNNKTDLSLTGEGTDEKPFTLVNDLETVPPHHYYGTDDEENVRGYFPLDEAITQIFNTNNYYNSLTASIYNIVINMMGGFKASYVVETALTTYTQESTWTTNEAENKIGNFKAVVTIHDTVTDTTWVLQNVLGFDYVGTPVSLDRTILTDSSLTLALSVNGSNYLQATVNNMPNNVKRIHFCFERCTQKVVFNILTAKVGEFILLGLDVVFNLQRGTLFETGTFMLTGNSIGSPNSLLAETGNFLIETSGIGFTEVIGGVPSQQLVVNTSKATFVFTFNQISIKNRMLLNTGIFRLTGKSATLTHLSIYTVNYGLLYNWYAATDSRNIANIGWHLNTINEWNTLRIYLDPIGIYYDNIAGGKLKEVNPMSWESPNVGATNEVGFNAKGSGRREIEEGITSFKNLKQSTEFWVYTTSKVYDEYGEEDTSKAWVSGGLVSEGVTLATSAPPIGITSLKVVGFSIRLVKDSTTLTNGQTGTYTGNDGKIYRTICIGTQEWLADNLCETKYRNGDWIHGYDNGVYTPISNSAWAALTTGALCAYDNDWNNV